MSWGLAGRQRGQYAEAVDEAFRGQAFGECELVLYGWGKRGQELEGFQQLDFVLEAAGSP